MYLLFKPCLFFLSFSPLWVSIIWIDSWSIILSHNHIGTEIISICTILITSIISTLVVFKQIQKTKKVKEATKILLTAEKEKAITSEYLLSYILPLFAFDFTLWRQVSLFLLFFSVLAFLCVKHSYVYANIILEICGYSFYNCTLETEHGNSVDRIIISKRNLSVQKEHEIKIASLGSGYTLDVTD